MSVAFLLCGYFPWIKSLYDRWSPQESAAESAERAPSPEEKAEQRK
jgi:hypothetical protein